MTVEEGSLLEKIDLYGGPIPPPPKRYEEYNTELVKAADELLATVGERISVTGSLYQGKRLMKYLDPEELALLSSAEYVETMWSDADEVVALLETVSSVIDLTRKELELVKIIVEGEVWQPSTVGYQTIAVRLGRSANAVQQTWKRLKPKLQEHWAAPRETHRVNRLPSSIQGCIGRAISARGPAIKSMEKRHLMNANAITIEDLRRFVASVVKVDEYFESIVREVNETYGRYYLPAVSDVREVARLVRNRPPGLLSAQPFETAYDENDYETLLDIYG